ncbi:bifunctional DNA primase/polymerase, partial [Acinetobacter baumannii]|uniref:bifunctional DNA primase/polymerase n=1 Tax=Acinetobacter baumannii TaxID=470 RepID=UPI001BC86B5B
RAASDLRTMSMWRVQHPNASVAVRTGVAGGGIVLDITGTKGLRALEDRLGRLPEPIIEAVSAGGVVGFGFACRRTARGVRSRRV